MIAPNRLTPLTTDRRDRFGSEGVLDTFVNGSGSTTQFKPPFYARSELDAMAGQVASVGLLYRTTNLGFLHHPNFTETQMQEQAQLEAQLEAHVGREGSVYVANGALGAGLTLL